MVLFSIEDRGIASCTRGIRLNYPAFTGRSPESVKLIFRPVAECLANYIAGGCAMVSTFEPMALATGIASVLFVG
jgi:hypothetical protein